MDLELHINELILEGVPGYQREQIAAAIEAALTELVAEHGVPPELQKGGGLGSLTEQITSGSRPEVIGQQVAQAILGRMGAEPYAVQPGETKPAGMSAQNRSNS